MTYLVTTIDSQFHNNEQTSRIDRFLSTDGATKGHSQWWLVHRRSRAHISPPYFTTARRGENIISGSGPFLIFQLHYDVLQTSWVANSIANALNTGLLRLAGIGAVRTADLFEFLLQLNLGNCSAGGVGKIKTSS